MRVSGQSAAERGKWMAAVVVSKPAGEEEEERKKEKIQVGAGG